MFLCSPQLNCSVGECFTKEASPAGKCFTKEASPAACSGDDSNSVSWIPVGVSGDSASDVVESQVFGQNNALNLSEGSVAQSEHCSHAARVKNGSFDNGTLSVLSTALQTLKRADSLPSTLLRYVLVPYFMLKL